MSQDWFVYIVRCKDGSLYTGTTKDVNERIKVHNAGKGARYTQGRRPVVLVYKEDVLDQSKALIREYAIKALSKQEKEELIAKA